MEQPEERNLSIQVGTSHDLLKLVAPGLNAIPAVGSILAAAWSEFNIDRRLKRVEGAIERIQELLSNRFDLNSFATTAESMQLLERVLQRVESESSEQKRTQFCNLIVSSWITIDPIEGIFDESTLFSEATDRFTASHLAVLM